MKVLHTADLHLGKIVAGVSMLAEQREVLKQITTIALEEKVDAIIVAGDLYDRSIPPTDAVELLDEVLQTWNVEHRFPILAISGNHDSQERLAFGSTWYQNNKLFLKGKLTNKMQPIELDDTQFWLVPYHEPAQAREIFQDDAIRSHEDAMQRVVAEIKRNWDPTKAQVLIGHAFVAGGVPSDSERQLAIGNVDRVATQVFEAFTYTALGHLHHPHAIKHPTIHYSGSPLKYSFSEAEDHKSVRIVEWDAEGLISVNERELTPVHDMRILTGTLEALTTHIDGSPEDYLQIRLLDAGALIDPIGKLRAFYPNILHLERVKPRLEKAKKEAFKEVIQKDERDLFQQFFHYTTGETLSADQNEVLEEVIAEVRGADEN